MPDMQGGEVKPQTIEWRNDIPASVVQFAERRTNEMLRHYGHNITGMKIETLVASVYLQGIEDCFTYHEKTTTPQIMGAPNAVPLAVGVGDLGMGGI
jgi:hypothetical protein